MDAGYYLIDSGDIATLEALIAQRLEPSDVPFASDIQQNMPVYDVPALDVDDPALLAEWARVLRSGAGIICLGRAFPDTDPPLDGNAPETQADILRRAHSGGWSAQDLHINLDALAARRTA